MRSNAWLAFALLGRLTALAQNEEPTLPVEPGSRLEIVCPKPFGIVAMGINARGDLIGFEWVDDTAHPGVLTQAPFFAEGAAMTYLPLLPGYTATFPAGLSDEGRVVGRSSKPAPPGILVPMRNQAFVWDADHGIRGLGAFEGDNASLASGISDDGRRIAGVTVGQGRVRACVWNLDADIWRGEVLPQEGPTASSFVAISGDGRILAGIDEGRPCLWRLVGDGRWTREPIGDPGELIPRAVNNAGAVAGIRNAADGRTRAVVWTRDGGLVVPDLPPGYVRSEAHDLNNFGLVVGSIDGPNGSPIGPEAFIYEKGTLRIITKGGHAFTTATAINDRGQVAGVAEEHEDVPAEPGSKPDTPKPGPQ